MKPLGLIPLVEVRLAVVPPGVAAEFQVIPLPPRPTSAGEDLAKALERRHTSREFGPGKLLTEDLSAVLWAANGVNRPNGKRTAPTAMGEQYMDIYLVADEGAYLYDALAHTLQLVKSGGLKSQLAHQEHVTAASHVLVLVVDLDRTPGSMPTAAKLNTGHATTGTIAQNVALMCAARGIGTGIVEWIREDGIRDALNLRQQQVPLLVMPLGYLSN